MKLRNLGEDILIGFFFLGVLIPVRLLVLHLLGDHWYAMIGTVSGLVFLIFYLSKHGNLGLLGKIILRSISVHIQSKSIKGFLVFNLILIYILSNLYSFIFLLNELSNGWYFLLITMGLSEVIEFSVIILYLRFKAKPLLVF